MLRSADLSIHFLGDEGVVFDPRAQVLFSANRTATYILCCLQEGLTPAEVAGLLCDKFGLSPDEARLYVEQTLAQDPEDGIALGAATGDELFAPKSAAVAALRRPARVRNYRFLDSVFFLRYGTDALFDWVAPVLAHFAGGTGGMIGAADPAAGDDTAIFDITPHRGGYAILERGQVLETCGSIVAAAAMVKACFVYRALRGAKDFCAIHAGALQLPGQEVCLLLPGASGRGKSTLVAGLAARGFTMLADDTTVVTGTDFRVRPLPCCVAVKRGAWEILNPLYPDLAEAPIHRRPDGLEVRYLLPRRYAPPATRAPIKALVFPAFEPNAATAALALAKGEALRRLMACFLPLRKTLTSDEVRSLVAWIDRTPCFDLRLSSLDSAIGAIERLPA